ncbi:MAG: TonB-dependent receptor [Novosphingobium sp.]|nr:TonB-dependent receptor [Novosphingobium sp.]
MSDNVSGVIAPRSLRASSDRMRHASALVGLSAAMLVPGHAFAQDADAPLASVTVEDTAIDPNPNAQLGVPFKAKTSGDERRSRPLAETPATITVLTRAQIEQSGYTDLTRILDAQPGVTVGTGENGNAFGDRYVIRGQDVKSDVFVDGLRDPGLQTRESFAIEQLEITKGPSSSFAGRGASGGSVNAITKMATTDLNFGKATAGYGSDNYVRTTADVNYVLGSNVAVRVNALYTDGDVPFRSPASRKRYGVAVSALFAPTDNLKIILDYYGLRARDKPDIGSFLVGTGVNRLPVSPLLPAYAQKNDFQNSDIDTFTARLKYNFSDSVRISNSFRYGKTYNAYAFAGSASRVVPTATGGYQTGTIDSGHVGWQDLTYVANQTNLSADVDLFGAKHQFILGVEYTNHKVSSTNGAANGTTSAFIPTQTGTFNCPSVLNGPNNGFCITDASGNAVPNLENLTGRTWTRTPFAARKWNVETISGYLMDTVDITPAVTLFGGVRLDHYTFDISQFVTTTGAPSNFVGRTTNSFSYTNNLWNGHLGLTYKVGHGGIFYATVSTAADINGGESDTTGAGYGGFLLDTTLGDVARPERSWNYEIGTKWNILDEKLLLTASLFRTVKSDVMEGADYGTFGTFNTGKLRVQGFELSVAGNITDKWSVQGGFTVMRAKILESANSGISLAQAALGATNVGKTLANFANVSAEFMTRYQITDKFAMGGAFKYKGERYGGQPDTAAVYSYTSPGYFLYSQPVPSYVVADLTAEYHLTKNIELRLNVNNIFNKEYYLAAYRAGFFLYKGDGRQVVGAISASF